jgi:hypothetical protein
MARSVNECFVYQNTTALPQYKETNSHLAYRKDILKVGSRGEVMADVCQCSLLKLQCVVVFLNVVN